jgi:hypothetical protein
MRAHQLAYGRAATDAELDLIRGYLETKDPGEVQAQNKLTRWERVAHALLSSNEFLYVD